MSKSIVRIRCVRCFGFSPISKARLIGIGPAVDRFLRSNECRSTFFLPGFFFYVNVFSFALLEFREFFVCSIRISWDFFYVKQANICSAILETPLGVTLFGLQFNVNVKYVCV